MPPTATMVIQDQQTKPGNRRSVIPAIPRALERNKKVSKTSDIATPSTASDSKEYSHGLAAERPTASGDDWASMVGEEQTETSKEDGTPLSREATTFSEPTPAINGYELAAEQKPEPLAAPVAEPIKQETSLRHNRILSINGATHVAPPQRFDPGIVFGGSVVSNESSPILPPSASSTNHTQPTPLSDAISTHSQPSYQGYGHSHHSSVNIPPSKAMFPGPPLPGALDPRYVPSAPHPNIGHDIMDNPRAMSASAESLQSYLCSQFNNKDLADIQLHLSVNGREATLYLHRVLVARCPKVRALLETVQVHVEGGKISLFWDPGDGFVSISDIIEALRVCYGGPVSASSFPMAGFRVPPIAQDRGFVRMENCLGYLAAGQILQLPEVAAVGVESATNFLTLPDLEHFFLFALDGAVDALDSPQDVVIANAIARGTHAPYANHLIVTGINFLAQRLHRTFTLDPAAYSSDGLGGIPNFPETPDIGHKRVSSNPRLSLIQFGDMVQSDQESTTLTTILMGLPFEIIRHVLGQLMYPDTTRAVVEERERRRREYCKRFFAFPDQYEGDPAKKKRCCWEEGIDASGMGITRRWVGE